MPGKQLSVVVTRRLPEVVETRMTELFNVDLRTTDAPMTTDELAEAMAGADVLVSTITDKIDAKLLARAGDRLKLIANYGAGVDNIDVATARQRGIHVSNTPGVVTEDTADMVMALILGVTRRLAEGLRLAQSNDWQGWSPTAMLGGGCAAAAWAYLVWAGLAGPWPAALLPLGCRCIITIAGVCALRSKRPWMRPTGKASIRWSRE